MAKNNKKEEQKKNITPKKPEKAPNVKNPEAKKPENKPETVQVEVEEEVNLSKVTPKNLASRHNSGLSPDSQVQLLDLARRTFVEEKDPDLQFPKQVAIRVNKIVAVGILCELADHATNGNDSFAAVLQTQAYPSLTAAAEEIGFKLPDIKSLPAGEKEGTVLIDAKTIEIPKEAKEKLKHEQQVREAEKPELDPEKISSEEDLQKALEYMFITKGSRNLVGTLTDGIDFMKKFRLHEASLAENKDEATAKFNNYNSGDWLDDLFSHVEPSIFFTGIGKGMASVAAAEGTPIHAFTIFRDAVKDKKTNQPVLDDQELAYCVKSIIKWVCTNNISSNEKTISELDEKKNKKEIETCKSAIEKWNNVLAIITNPSSEVVTGLLDNVGSHFTSDGSTLTPECQLANSIYNQICKTYYGKQLSNADYSNLDKNIQQYAGHIINLFRDPASQMMDYGMSNISELVERTEEEKTELRRQAKKDWDERKKANEKNA